MDMTKNQIVSAESIINGINMNDANVKRIKKEQGLVERENKIVLTEDNKQILLG